MERSQLTNRSAHKMMTSTIIVAISLVMLLSSTSARMADLHNQHPSSNITSGQIRRDAGNCGTPTSKAKVILPSSLYTGPDLPYEMYSGYVGLTAQDYLFYWYFSNQKGSDNSPLIIWTNGGPGCSAMEGATTEVSPLMLFRIKLGEGLATGKFSENALAWNKNADVLFIDNPRQVGYSFGPTKTHSSASAADDIVTFMIKWYDLFPQLKNRDVYLAGESYAGHYLPAWASKMMDHNDRGDLPAFNLKGILIGNGCISDSQDTVTVYTTFAKEANLIPQSASPPSTSAVDTLIRSKLGYNPNYYDYRIKDLQCVGCYSYNYGPWGNFFMREDVMKALHVCSGAGIDAFGNSAGGCINVRPFDSHDNFDYVAQLGRALDRGIRVFMMYGKNDLACNYVGGRMIANDIPWKQSAKFNREPLTPLRLGDREIGQIKTVGPLTFFQIDGAGHMVPLDNPVAASFAIDYLMEVAPVCDSHCLESPSSSSTSSSTSSSPPSASSPVPTVTDPSPPYSYDSFSEPGTEPSTSSLSGALIACIIIISLLTVVLLFGVYKWYKGSLIIRARSTPTIYAKFRPQDHVELLDDEDY